MLEGDLPPAPKQSGPGTRYILGTEPLVQPYPGITTAELPESYGTTRLFLAARDPHWLCASWDLGNEQQQAFNARSRDGHLVLRVFARDNATPVVRDVHLNPESRHWFIHVPFAETRYWAELGYYDWNGSWHGVSVSAGTFTPPEGPSPDLSERFATVPPSVTFQQIVEVVQEFVSESRPLLEAVVRAQEAEETRVISGRQVAAGAPVSEVPSVVLPERIVSSARAAASSHAASRSDAAGAKAERVRREAVPAETARPRTRETASIRSLVKVEPGRRWTAAQRDSLARLIQLDEKRRVWIGSIEITELIRRGLEAEMASMAAAEVGRGLAPEKVPGEIPLISSPMGAEQPRKARKFWFKINAELVVYGATEPDARVTIAGRPVRLRPDGTFSFRFSLPDGRYQLPAVARSSDGEDEREARLEFSRSTDYRGNVPPARQDAGLRPPKPENL